MRCHLLVLCAALVVLGGCAPAGTGPRDPVPVGELAETLRQALPTGSTARVSPADQPGMVRYDDGKGVVVMAVSVGRVPPDQADQATACPLYSQHPYARCVRHTRPDGGLAAVDQDHVQPLTPTGVERWTALSVTAAGEFVALTEWNAADADAAPTRPHPPLTPDQLLDVAGSPRWVPLAKRLPTQPRPPTTPEFASDRILAVLRQELAPAIRLERKDTTSRGYVEATVDDGSGEGLLTVTVQQWQRPDDPDLVDLFRNARTTADGTQVTTRRQSPTADTVQEDADVRTPGGLRVAVSQVNAPAFGLPATRAAPLLTVDQLTRLASALLRAAA